MNNKKSDLQIAIETLPEALGFAVVMVLAAMATIFALYIFFAGLFWLISFLVPML